MLSCKQARHKGNICFSTQNLCASLPLMSCPKNYVSIQDLEAFVGLTRCRRVAAWPGATRVNFTCAGEGDRITVKRMRPEGR